MLFQIRAEWFLVFAPALWVADKVGQHKSGPACVCGPRAKPANQAELCWPGQAASWPA